MEHIDRNGQKMAVGDEVILRGTITSLEEDAVITFQSAAPADWSGWLPKLTAHGCLFEKCAAAVPGPDLNR